MAEMLPVITISPEMNLSLDPSTGILGAMMGREVIIMSMDGINEQIDSLEASAEDLYTALDPTTTSEGSYPGREGVYLTAGKLTNVVYGFIFGLLLVIGLLMITKQLIFRMIFFG